MTAGALVLACVLDAALGDPRWLPHPVRLMGRLAAWYERRIRRIVSHRPGELAAGLVLAVGLPAVSYGMAWLVIALASRLDAVVGQGVEVFLAFTTLAARDLVDHASAVVAALDRHDHVEARRAVGLMVGRDTMRLDEPEIVRATLESVAENASDGIIAPLLYLALGGVPLAMAYKAINTLDSMVGYRTERYLRFGWASARLDDLANLLPARLTGLLLVGAAPVVGLSPSSTWRTLWRDGHRHPSPNSGYPEAAVAGALGVQLGGRNFYGGVERAQPVLGEPRRPLERQQIVVAVRLVVAAAGLFLSLILLVMAA
jgi:adenosylcobinamide-phosphate synthase